MEQGKTCTKCGEWKLFEGFYKRSKNGRSSHCKDCTKQYQQEYKERNKDRVRENNKEAQKRYYQKNKERKSEYAYQYRQENKEKLSEYRRQYYQENPEKHKEQAKQWYQENFEKVKEQKKQYNKKNAKQIYEYSKQYRQKWLPKNAERVREYQKQYSKQYIKTEKGKEASYRSRLKRRSYKHHVTFTPHQRKPILDRDNWQCQSCGIKVHDRNTGDWNTPDKAHIDHIIPISKGGNSEPSNLQTLCRTCNLSKHDKVEKQLSLF
jgi:5-methylcytosine-specific restriction endonuclease McrA